MRRQPTRLYSQRRSLLIALVAALISVAVLLPLFYVRLGLTRTTASFTDNVVGIASHTRRKLLVEPAGGVPSDVRGLAKYPLERQSWLQSLPLTLTPFYAVSPYLVVSADIAEEFDVAVAFNMTLCGLRSAGCVCAASPFLSRAAAAADALTESSVTLSKQFKDTSCWMTLAALDTALRDTVGRLLTAESAPLVLHDRSETLEAVLTTKYGRQDNDPAVLAAALRSKSSTELKRALLPSNSGHSSLPHFATLHDVLLSPEGTAFPMALAAGGGDGESVTLASADGFAVQSCGHLPRAVDMDEALDDIPLYDEVLVLTHRWSSNPYHYMAEALANRLYPVLGYFKARTSVRVQITFEEPQSDPHAAAASNKGKKVGKGGGALKPVHLEALEALGISRDRVVHGWVRARLAHLPDGVLCAHASPLGLVLGREAIRAAVGLPQVPPFGRVSAAAAAPPILAVARAESSPALEQLRGCLRDRSRPLRVLLPQRKGTRSMTNFEELRSGLEALPAEVLVLSDDALPPQADIWRSFGRADAVVAQNGAALANVIAMAPGAAIFE